MQIINLLGEISCQSAKIDQFIVCLLFTSAYPIIKMCFRELYQVFCRDWLFLYGWALEPKYTPPLLKWADHYHWPLRVVTSQLQITWTGPPPLCQQNQASSPHPLQWAVMASKCVTDWDTIKYTITAESWINLSYLSKSLCHSLNYAEHSWAEI